MTINMTQKHSMKYYAWLLACALFLTAKAADCCEIHSSTPTCQQLHQIELSLDPNTEPCEDFYGHACNNWALLHSSTEYNGTVSLLDYQMNLKLISVMDRLQQEPVSMTVQNIFDKSYIYYKSCVHEKSNNISRYFDIIKPGPGLEWPLLEQLQAYRRGEVNFSLSKWPAGQFNLFTLLGQLGMYGLNNVLLSHYILKDSETSVYSLIRRTDFEESHSIDQQVLMSLLTDWGLPEELILKYTQDIKNTEEYWHSLYKNYSAYTSIAFVTFQELKQQYPQLSTFMETLLPPQFRDMGRISFFDEKYFQFLYAKQWSAEEIQDVCNYIMIKFYIHLLEDNGPDLTKLQCIKDLKAKLDSPLNLLYYQYIYQPEELSSNRDIISISNKTRHYLMDTIRENNLNLSAYELNLLDNKMSTVALNVGNLPQNLHISRITKFFEDIPPLELNNYYNNHLHLLRHRFLKSLLPRENQTYFIVGDRSVNGRTSSPFYSGGPHMVVLPFGFLQPPIYHHTYEPVFKWSMLGYQLAHQYSLGISGPALLNLRTKPFEHCGHDLTNVRSTYDVVSDLVGVRVAYRAYSRDQNVQLQPEFSKISWKKLFYLNLSQWFCVRQDYLKKGREETALRLHNIIKNMESFAEAFQCPVGSKMNPREKCTTLLG